MMSKLPLHLSLSVPSRVRVLLGIALFVTFLALFVVATIRFLRAEDARLDTPVLPEVTVPVLERTLIEQYAGRVFPAPSPPVLSPTSPPAGAGRTPPVVPDAGD